MEASTTDTLVSLRVVDWDRKATGSNPCEICGKDIKVGSGLLVETDQGDYAIGSTCQAKAKRAGLVVKQDWRQAK